MNRRKIIDVGKIHFC